MAKTTKKKSKTNNSQETSGGRRILLTGTSGFLGNSLLERLSKDSRVSRLIAVDMGRY